MKYFLYLVLCTGLFIAGCADDDTPSPVIDGNILHYDGSNNTAPSLPDGIFEATARFPSDVISGAIGRNIIGVDYYIAGIPIDAEIVVYDDNGSNTPGDIIYTANVLSEIESNRWNTHTLAAPVEIIGNGVWISFRFEHNSQQRTIGCDPGPARTNGDWMYDSFDNLWLPFRNGNRGSESINWNIRGILSN